MSAALASLFATLDALKPEQLVVIHSYIESKLRKKDGAARKRRADAPAASAAKPVAKPRKKKAAIAVPPGRALSDDERPSPSAGPFSLSRVPGWA